MKTTIRTSEELTHKIETEGLKPAASLQALCLHMIEHAFYEKKDFCLIQIARHLIPSSYITVPAMMAKSMEGRCPFPILQSFLRGEYIVVRAGNEKAPITFKARAIAAIQQEKKFVCTEDKTPESYRVRPSILSSVLTRETGMVICNYRKNGKLEWKVVDN